MPRINQAIYTWFVCIFRMVPADHCSSAVRLDAPVLDGGEELLGDGDNIRTGAAVIQDSTLINLRQARALNEVCCSIDDIIDEDKSCDDTEGFK